MGETHGFCEPVNYATLKGLNIRCHIVLSPSTSSRSLREMGTKSPISSFLRNFPPQFFWFIMDFELVSDYSPTGDQPTAIEALVKGVKDGEKNQILLGVTGSGKTFTMANIIA